MIYFLQSPTESLNSDSRPGSVLDEQENTSDPPDTPMPDVDKKETDAKATESPSTDEASANAQPKDEKPASNTDKPNSADKEKDEKDNFKHSGDESSHSADEKGDAAAASGSIKSEAVVPVAKANSTASPTPPLAGASSATVPTVAATTTSASPENADLKPIEKIEGAQEASKEQEIISTVANIKKEANVPGDGNSEYTGKKVSMVIKKEPGDESAENNSNTTAKDGEPPAHDIKLANEIKTENKCGLDLTDTNNKYEDAARPAFEPHIKFNKSSPDTKFNSELPKQNESTKFPQDSPFAPKYPPVAADLSQKYDAKLYAEPNKFHESETKDKPNADGKLTAKQSAPIHCNSHFTNSHLISAVNAPAKYPVPQDQIKHENVENMALKRPPYAEPYQHIRSPYEQSAMLKYPPPPGAPGMLPGLPQDLKYTPPALDMKFKPPENLSKAQFSADNLVKGYAFRIANLAIKIKD